MTRMHVAVVLGALGITSAHVAVQEPAVPRPSSTPEPIQSFLAPARNPYSNIFVVPPAPQDLRELATRARAMDAKPRVVCGMTLVPGKPELDPKMVLQRPSDQNVEPKIRVLTPRVCRE